MKKDNKTIGITIRFFTNDLPGRVGPKKDQIPFWSCGNVHLEANKTKGIKPQNEIFNYFDDIPRAIRSALAKSKLVAVDDISRSIKARKRAIKNNER